MSINPKESGIYIKKRILDEIDRHPDLFFAIFSFITAFLSYAVLMTQLGLYGDDANFLWAYHRAGPAEYKLFLGWNREIGYLFYQYISPFLQDHILTWRILCFILRWVSTILVYRILKKSYPDNGLFISWISMFFLLYPGFLEQSIPVEFTLHFATLCFLLSSFRITQHLIIRQRRYWIFLPISLVLEFLGLFLIEYFVGLEFFRPVLIWTMLSQINNQKDKLRKLILWEVPYAAVLLSFIIWRAFFSQSGYIQPNVVQGLSSQPLQYISELLIKVFHYFKVAAFEAWGLIFRFPNGQKTMIFYLVIVFCTFLLFYLFSSSIRSSHSKSMSGSDRANFRFFLIGLFCFLVSGIPAWSAGLQLELSLFWDRITLSFILGASLMFGAVLSLLIRKKYQPVLFSLLIAIMAGYQFLIQNQFRKDWTIIQNTFWQLRWRAPDIQPGTMLLTDQLPFNSITDNSLNALLNWNYENPQHPDAEPYKFFQISARMGYLQNFDAGKSVSHNDFEGNTSDSLVIYGTPSTCLKVLDKNDVNLPFLNSVTRQSLKLSNPARIISEPTREIQFQEFMGVEPPHTWCYYYEKGELAAQNKNWAETLAMGKEAMANGFYPSTTVELKSFVFSALAENDLETAALWTDQIMREEGNEAFYQKQIAAFAKETTLSKEASLLLDKLILYSQKNPDD